MIKHKDSHLDHALTEAQTNYIFERFADRTSFFIETFELPETLGMVPCGLFGPIMGDAPVEDRWVEQARRGNREYTSRVFAWIQHPLGEGPQGRPRQVRQVTVIAGPHQQECSAKGPLGPCFKGQIEHLGMHPSYGTHMEKCHVCDGTGVEKLPCILYTAFGGPLAPKEPGDIKSQIEQVRHGPLDDLPKADKLAALEQNLIDSMAFWREHALVNV